MKYFLSDKELSYLLSLSRVTLYRLRLSGMPYMRVGGQLRYDLDAVLEWLKSERSA